MMGVPSRRFFDLSCFPAPVESLLPWCLEQGLWRHRAGGRRGGPDHGLRQFEGPVVRGGVGGSSLGSFAGRLAALKSGATVTFPEGPAAQRYDGCMACSNGAAVSHSRLGRSLAKGLVAAYLTYVGARLNESQILSHLAIDRRISSPRETCGWRPRTRCSEHAQVLEHREQN